jgi:hypothetical protein
MMLLGDLLSRFADEAIAAETILRVGDLATIAAMQKTADELGLTLGAYASQAVRFYTDSASDEEWTTLIGLMTRAEDPGAVCLKRAFAYGMRAQEEKRSGSCSNGSTSSFDPRSGDDPLSAHAAQFG